MNTNWNALQVPRDKSSKQAPRPVGVLPRYLSMGSFHASIRHGGKSVKPYACTGRATVKE